MNILTIKLKKEYENKYPEYVGKYIKIMNSLSESYPYHWRIQAKSGHYQLLRKKYFDIIQNQNHINHKNKKRINSVFLKENNFGRKI